MSATTPTDGCLSIIGRIELNNASPSRAAIRLVLNLGPLDFADSGEEFD